MVSLQVLYQWFPSRETEPSLCGSKEHQDHWFVSQSPDGQGYDHLCVTGSSLKWYRGLRPDAHTLQKVYTVEDKILQTLWCMFEDKDSEKNAESGDSLINKKKDKEYTRCICIREQGLLSLFMESGAFYYVPLPFMVKHIWSLKSGILIERHVESQTDDHLPVLFTLTHPLDDLRPVTYRKLVSFLKDTSMSSLGYITSPQLKIVAVCSDHTPPLAVIYDKGDHIHTLWSINEATTEDIPSPVSTPDPRRIGFVSHVTPTPLSSSAPARYSHYSPLTPIKFSLQVQPPVPTSTESTVKKHNTLQSPLLDSLKPLPIQRLQQRGSPYCFTGTPQYKSRRSLGGDGGASGSSDAISRIASGRSPYINRYVTPQSGQQVSKNPVRAKSLSPRLHYARISPYSQTMNSRSWSTFYNEDLLNEHVDSLLPQICLHQIWAELPDQNIMYHCSSNTFVTCDLTGTNYLCFHLSTSNQLWLLSLSSQGDTIDVGPITTVHNVYQVVNLSALKMMLILTVNGDIVLYSGDRKVIDVNASFLYSSMGLSPDHTNGCEAIHVLRDAIGSEFTVVTKTGLSFRCSIPQSPTHPVVSLCLQALCSVLPTQTCTEFMVAYCGYSFCSNFQIETSWNRFENWLYACLRMRPSLLSTKKMDVSSGSDPWSMVLQVYSEDSLLSRDPVLKLLTEKEDITSYASNQGGVVDSTHTVSLEQHIVCVTSALHLVYEELKLDVHLHQYLAQLASLLCTLTRHLGWTNYVDYYCRDIPTLFQSLSSPIQTQSTGESHHNMVEDKPVYDLCTPPGIYQCLYALLQGREVQPFPVLSGVCKRSEQVMKLYSLLAKYWQLIEPPQWQFTSNISLNRQSSDMEISEDGNELYLEKIVNYLTQEFSVHKLGSFPVGVALLIWFIVFHCRLHPSSKWSSDTYQLIGRDDIGYTLYYQKSEFTLKLEQSVEKDDGMNFDEEILKLRFPRDLRVNEVRRLLCSSKPVRVALEQRPEVSDHEFLEQQESHLLTLCQRTMSLPIGRGMFTMATVHPMPTAPLNIPQLNLTGRAPPRNSTIKLDQTDSRLKNMTDWPDFHNGVAAGLKIAPGISKLDSTWIVFNQPSENQGSNEYAGFLMALGLNGHLTSLTAFNTFEYLQNKHELTVIALLLGISAASCGSMNLSIASLFSIFFPPLLPPGAADLEISILMQTAAMMGLGLLYMGSCHRYMVETMLKEIGHSPGPELEFAQDRESYSLVAGLSLGMIGLGAGNENVSLSGLNLVDQLCIYMNGGRKKDVIHQDNPISSYLVLECDQVNTHVTASGAILALGLIFLKTNDHQIAAHLAPPTTSYQLDCVRPDYLMLRTLCSGLILWDSVQPTQDWINSCIPQIVQQDGFYGEEKKGSTTSDYIDVQTMSQAFIYIITGCCLALGFRFAGTCQQDVKNCLMTNYRQLFSRLQSSSAEQAGKTCLETCIQNVLISLAMVMSGSGDLDILRLVRRHHTRVGQAEVNYGCHMATHMALGLLFLGGGRYCLCRSNTAIAALLCSLYPHYPISSTDNRYHLQALRHLYVLAVEPRVLVTREWDTSQSCSVPVRLHCHQNDGFDKVIEGITPCLLPDWDKLTEIKIIGPRYWSVKYQLVEDNVKRCLMKCGTIYVKRHSGYSSYESDPEGQKSILSLAVLSPNQYQLGGIKGKVEIPNESLQHDPWIRQFYRYLCQHGQQIYSAALLDCINEEKLELLNVYLQMEEMCSGSVLSGHSGIQSIWQAKLCWALSQLAVSRMESNITLAEYMESVMMRLNNWLENKSSKDETGGGLSSSLYHYINNGAQLSLSTLRDLELLAITLLLQDIPSLSSLSSNHNSPTGTSTTDIVSLLHAQGVSPSATVKTLLALSSPFIQYTL